MSLQAEAAVQAHGAKLASRPFQPRLLSNAATIFIGLQLMDLLTTWFVFLQGGVELNPVVRALIPWTGRFLAVLISKVGLVLLVLLLNRRPWILRFANLLYTCIVAWNVWILWALRSHA